MALNDHPEWRSRFAAGDEGDLETFVEEVRRFYPFFPAIGGRVREPFEWKGIRFEKGQWVLLDLYGTNHHPGLFAESEQFLPDRELSWRTQGYDFIPQGGGDPRLTHRCPGEGATVELMKEAVRLLSRSMRYNVTKQDLRIYLSRIPARPESGFVISNISRTGP